MDTTTYKNRKETALGLIEKTKRVNPELSAYLKQHIVFEDRSRTLMYTGDETVLKELMENSDTDEIQDLMDEYGLDIDQAITVKEIMDEYGVDAEDAVGFNEAEIE